MNSRHLLRLGCAGAFSIAVTTHAATKPHAARTDGTVSPAALADAAKSARLSQINYGRALCDADRTVEAWLNEVVGQTAASIRWRGGSCQLVNELNPLDAGSRWCGGATIVTKGHPEEPAEIEIYFEAPVDGKPGPPYAFRAVHYDIDGLDYKRDFIDFDHAYRSKHVPGFVRPETRDCD